MTRPFFQDKNKKIQEIIRVNHAGEFGAQQIYQGQINYTKNKEDKKILVHMLEQEQEHLDYFADKIKSRQSRPTIFMPIWKICGYLMGALSAQAGIKSAMLVTENVETIIENHYEKQIDYLSKNDPKNPILDKIKQFQQDEIEHKNIAIESQNDSIFFPYVIRNVCKLAIFLSKKL